MAEYTITPANLVTTEKGTNAIADEAIVAGQLFYLDSEDSNRAKLCQADAEATATVKYMALNSAAADQPVAGIASGTFEVGSIFTAAGKVLALSPDTAGKMIDVGDISTGEFLSIVGWSTSATAFQLNIANTGIEMP